jgi:hypothetical protein
MIVILLGTAACAPSELKPVKVGLSYISNEWYGEETIVADSLFTFENPNSYPVSLDSFNYAIYLGDQSITQKTVGPGVMIPANSIISLTYANVLPFTGFGGVAFEGYYMGKSMEYFPAHIAGAAPWKLLGGKEPPLWYYAALGILPTIRSGPSTDDVKAGTADTAAITALYAKVRGSVDAIQGAMDKAWTSYPAGPCVYKVVGKATISSPNFSKSLDTPFTITYTRP